MKSIRTLSEEAAAQHPFRYYDYLLAATCVIVVCSNIIGAGKVSALPLPFGLEPFAFGAGVLFFPLSYILGDVLTEVYGFKKAKRTIRAATAAALFAALMAGFITIIPPAEGWNTDLGGVDRQTAFASSFGQAPRIVLASLAGLYVGEIVNARVMAAMKSLPSGTKLWQRTIGSTVVGQAADSIIFYPLAFIGVWPLALVLQVMVTNYLLKVTWEAVLTPVTYKVVGLLKSAEGVEVTGGTEVPAAQAEPAG
jgi:uncharacterized integral membrane protein (TIGR00697 family)